MKVVCACLLNISSTIKYGCVVYKSYPRREVLVVESGQSWWFLLVLVVVVTTVGGQGVDARTYVGVREVVAEGHRNPLDPTRG